MDEVELNLQVGNTIQIQATLPENAPRFSVRILGYLPAGSLIVTTPTLKGKVQIVREGRRFSVRMLQGDSVLGFVAKVLHSYLKPYPHLHLEFPRSIEQIVVRNAVRVTANIPVRIRNTRHPESAEHVHLGQIEDLSESGAKIRIERNVAEVGDTLQLTFPITVLDEEEQITMLADYRNAIERIENGAGGKHMVYYAGVQFRSINRFQQVLLHAWTMGHLARSD